MLLCTACLHVDDRKLTHCPCCGETAFARVTKNGDLVSVPAEAGMPCQSCMETERELKLRYYRRVLGLLVMDRIWAEAGYFCGACRRKHLAKNLGFTLVLGWWGLMAAIFRNPYAIVVNLWALFRPPFGAADLGAMNAQDIRGAAARDEQREQRLSDVYMRMPGWMESLTEDEVARIMDNIDYYAVLDVDRPANHREIKAAWRVQAKLHHPDLSGTTGHERIVAINHAWQVLGDERLRYAYDHWEQLLSFLQEAEVVASEFDEQDAGESGVMVVGCTECRFGFESFDDAADHVDRVHPHTDYQDILVSLVDDDDEDVDAESDRPSSAPSWRCKACPEVFADYEGAIRHADRVHPERVTVDPRAAVEAV